jgi:hypothetical protein
MEALYFSLFSPLLRIGIGTEGSIVARFIEHGRDSYFYLYLFLLRRRKRRRGIDYMTTPLQQTTTLHTVYVCSNNNINNINTREGMKKKGASGVYCCYLWDSTPVDARRVQLRRLNGWENSGREHKLGHALCSMPVENEMENSSSLSCAMNETKKLRAVERR